MSITRRDLLAGIGSVAATVALERLGAQVPVEPSRGAAGSFPLRNDFLIEDGYTYINAAYTHPIPRVSLEAARRALEGRGSLRSTAPVPLAADRTPRALFAELINARPSEIAYVFSTSAGENLVIQALELDRRFHGNVVSDGLHFEGALLHLNELKQRGLDVRIAPATKDGRIQMKDLERLVDRDTRLIEISSAAMYNGFQHELKAVANLAHAHGAYVYVDIIQSAGAEPLDMKASGVDFAACSSFKWLMGDFGLGFLYVREALLDRFPRPVDGYLQATQLDQHYPPFFEGAGIPVSYTLARTASGVFETGTLAASVAVNTALLAASLAYIKGIGVANIQAHRQPLLRKLHQELPRLGFMAATPPESTGGIITFAKQGVGESELPARLQRAKINVRFDKDWMRLSPSVYNDMADIDRFLEVLSA